MLASSKRAALEAHFREWDARTLDYKSTDCVRFVASWVGVDVATWSSEAGALRSMKVKYHAGRVADAASQELGPHVAITEARYGDVVALDTPPLDTLGICIGRESVFLGDGVLVRRPTLSCFRAWKVET